MAETSDTAMAERTAIRRYILDPPPLSLFDHLVGAGEHGWRDGEAERLRGLEIDHQFVLGRCLYRQVSGLLALEDAVDVAGRTPILVGKVGTVGDQPATGDEQTGLVDCGQLVPGRELNNELAMNKCQRASSQDQAAIRRACEFRDGALDLRRLANVTGMISTPNAAATDWMAANWPMPAVIAGSRRTATRLRPGAIALSNSSHFPLRVYSNCRNPVALPPGRARLSTKPAPTGSGTATNTIGTARVA